MIKVIYGTFVIDKNGKRKRVIRTAYGIEKNTRMTNDEYLVITLTKDLVASFKQKDVIRVVEDGKD